MSAEQLARFFHEAYERLAPGFGYATRSDTRAFFPESPNGRLMIAVAGEVLAAMRATPAPGAPGQEAAAVRKDSLTTQAAAVQAMAQETDRDWSKAQDWKGMDGATAFLLINRHSDGWGDVGAMMNAWLAANAAGEKTS